MQPEDHHAPDLVGVACPVVMVVGRPNCAAAAALSLAMGGNDGRPRAPHPGVPSTARPAGPASGWQAAREGEDSPQPSPLSPSRRAAAALPPLQWTDLAVNEAC